MLLWLQTHAGIVGLLFFFVFFVLMALWTFRPGARDLYRAQARIPFEKDS